LSKALSVAEARTENASGKTRHYELEASMNQQLEEVLERVKAFPDDRQWEVAEVLLASLDHQSPEVYLSPEKIARAERYAASPDHFATDEEVREMFARLTADKGSGPLLVRFAP
jgi:hypothetical protein